MTNDIVLLGGTDITLTVAKTAQAIGIPIRLIVQPPRTFQISYSTTSVSNLRAVDLDAWGEAHDIKVIEFESYDQLITGFGAAPPALALVAGWYHMIPRRFRALFRRGCIGIHASLLPDLRGGAPLNWAILTGRTVTGVTLFGIDDGVDTGPIFGQHRLPIGPRTTINELVVASRDAAATLIRMHLQAILDGKLHGRPQAGIASYGLQRTPDDGQIDWRAPTLEIDRIIRAVGRPYAGAWTLFYGETICIWTAAPFDEGPKLYGRPGQIVRIAECPDPLVITGDGALRIVDASFKNQMDSRETLLKASQRRFSWSNDPFQGSIDWGRPDSPITTTFLPPRAAKNQYDDE